MRYTDAAVAGLRGEMMGEVRSLAASVREAETKRSADVERLSLALAGVPQLDAIQKSNRQAVGWAVGISIAAVSVLLAALIGGMDLVGSFADHIVGAKQQQAQVEQQRKADAERQARIEAKINEILQNKKKGGE